jgi:2-oxoglutarate dehydrogenase E2 component (dihydrolipoamide succinyltransferase)
MRSPASPLRGTTERLSPLRKIIAQRMLESLRVSAQLTTVIEADVTDLVALRARVKDGIEARTGVKPSYLPFMAKAALEALRSHPKLNASIDAEGRTVTYHDSEHLAIAVDTPRGLLAPVIRDAGELDIAGLTGAIAEAADQVRAGTMPPERLSGGTFTLTNTGSLGALFDTPIINQPQVAILGTGAVVERPVVVRHPDTGARSVEIRAMVHLALSYDHRLVDGADAARYLADVKNRLETADFAVGGVPEPAPAARA